MDRTMNTSATENVSYVFREGYLFCEKICVKELIKLVKKEKAVETPFFIYSRSRIVGNIYIYKRGFDVLENEVLLGYSIKANNNLSILKLFKEFGCTGVAVSGNEILLALKSGFSPEKIVFNGTGKLKWEIEVAVKNRCFLNVDSIFDLKNIMSVSKSLNQVHPFLATGVACSKFGIDEQKIDEILSVIKENQDDTNLVGLHCHLGSTIEDVKVFGEMVDVMLKLIHEVGGKGIGQIKYLNIGGGLGINYRKNFASTYEFANDQEEKPTVPCPGDLISEIKTKLTGSNLTLILEPGRSLIGNAGVLISSVLGVKNNSEKWYMVVDGSMAEVPRPALYGSYHHIELVEPSHAEQQKRVFDVVGPVCECGDFLGKDRYLNHPHEGCGVAIYDTGAYCASMASNYNMRMKPAEIMIDGGKWSVIRQQERLEDFLKVFEDT